MTSSDLARWWVEQHRASSQATTKPKPPPPPPPGGCVCGKGKVGGLLCWPCFQVYDDNRPPVR